MLTVFWQQTTMQKIYDIWMLVAIIMFVTWTITSLVLLNTVFLIMVLPVLIFNFGERVVVYLKG